MAATAETTTTPAHAAHPQQTWSRWTPSLPISVLDMLNPFAGNSNTDPKHTSKEVEPETDVALKRPILSAVQFDAGPPSPTRSNGSVMFAEPDTRSTSDDSREGSVDGVTRRLKKSSRPKTMFSICHPPPESRMKQKLHRRPRALLQLHRLQAAKRPLPALEVIPSANFSIRLTRAITKVIKARHAMCPNDLVVLKAEKYSTEEADEEQEARDVVGLICKGRKDEEKANAGKMFIHMASGRIWEAYATAIGGYECCTVDEHGLETKVRWVPKKNKDGSKTDKHGFRRFNFSTISPNSRRHPVIATLSKSGLDVNDTYKLPDAAAATPLSTPKLETTILENAMDDDAGGKELETDDTLREIISVTAIWVTFKEGWSPSFRFDGKQKDHLEVTAESPRKSFASPVATPPGSPANMPIDKRGSLKSMGSGIMRRASVLSRSNRSNRSSIASMPEAEPNSPTPSRSASVNAGRVGRARADSSSTVLVHRAASNRRKKNEPSSFRPDLVLGNDLHETSREDLAREFNGTSEAKKQPPQLQQSPLANVEIPDSTPTVEGTVAVTKTADALYIGFNIFIMHNLRYLRKSQRANSQSVCACSLRRFLAT
ncbi:uncharacterized protein MYCFIDRAFT_83122 [Pseudocercospora fijiensis CIRAD86]|uniref:Uncharacterized protein n=1 Tax=Pseudocercospora fijiensis (strain CIRAD86) TaxID=383855 RepID=M3A1Q4_PSEFD|nr:uncharacterized protein MYCFIDRAFT_83122 [Pseudocercospora fijiensis CIRAD86]EME85109.1 hypothetical protein MYCFIDRAFT_83122 [Pseudocercospora fijiensis CIRAD86]